MSDWLGRKPISIFVLGFGIFMLALSAYTFNWQTYMAARFVVGLCNGGTVVVVYTYAMELLLPEHRIPLRAFFNWGIARLLLTVSCYIYPDWRTASLACAVFTVPALILVIFVMPESPAWLHSKNKLEQMRLNEMQIARFGELKYEEVYHEPLLVPFDALNFSRRNLHQYAQLTVVICFCTLIYLVLFEEHGTSILVVNLLGVVFIEYTWDACYLCAVECMPTKLRASAVGSCSLVAGIGAVLAPTLAFMNTVWPPSAYFFVASLGLASLLVSFMWLVETKGVSLEKVKMYEEEPNRENEELVIE
uniref:Major facilitator superfamily (MFS) profile domain-containing protein n=1 Tax=Ditylenchus dipsaci TaxID=166011 RepID=A0A915EGC8_9BILA